MLNSPSILQDFISLLYPNNCCICSEPLVTTEKHLCLHCYYKLPKSRIDNFYENLIHQCFWGRTTIFLAYAPFIYSKKNSIQKLIAEVKYNGNKSLGIELGKIIGKKILNSPFLEDSLLAPIPLHPKKISTRGFNQSTMLCEGISEITGIPINENLLFRQNMHDSQTRKNRYERWENMNNRINLNKDYTLSKKHIILVDDVITTGATIEATANAFKNEEIKLSVLSFAFTNRM